MNNKLIVANWKMAPQSLAEAEGLLESTNNFLESMGESLEFSLVFCPPFIFLEDAARLVKMSHLEHEASLGAQDIFWEDQGADTGEISGPMLAKLGVEYVIVGHSERRWKLAESDEIVNKKLKAVLRNDMVPIVCIGERTRDSNFKVFLEEQISKTFEGLTSNEVDKCIIAYEPVWAISSNPGAYPDTPESALESIRAIKEFFTAGNHLKKAPLFLYGGSVNSKNVGDFLEEKEISGVLIGGASINKEEFIKILKVASQI